MVQDGIRRNFSPENYDQMIASDDTSNQLVLAMDVASAKLNRSSNASEGKRMVKPGANEHSRLAYQMQTG